MDERRKFDPPDYYAMEDDPVYAPADDWRWHMMPPEPYQQPLPFADGDELAGWAAMELAAKVREQEARRMNDSRARYWLGVGIGLVLLAGCLALGFLPMDAALDAGADILDAAVAVMALICAVAVMREVLR